MSYLVMSYLLSFLFFYSAWFRFHVSLLNIYVNLGLLRSLQEDFFFLLVIRFSTLNETKSLGHFFEVFEDIRTEEDRWTCL